MLDMALMSSASVLGSSSTFTSDCTVKVTDVRQLREKQLVVQPPTRFETERKTSPIRVIHPTPPTCIRFVNRASTNSRNIRPNADTSLRTIFLLPGRRFAWIRNFSDTSTRSMHSPWPSCSGKSPSWSLTKSNSRPVNVCTAGPKLSLRRSFTALKRRASRNKNAPN